MVGSPAPARRRILIVSENGLYPEYFGGMEIRARELVTHLRDSYDLALLTKRSLQLPDGSAVRWHIPRPVSKRDALGGGRVLRSIGNVPLVRARRRRLKKSLSAFRPDLLYLHRLHALHPVVVHDLLHFGRPVVGWFGDAHGAILASHATGSWVRRVVLGIAPLPPGARDRVTLVFNCEFLRQFYAPLVQGYANQFVIYDGVDCRRFHPAATTPGVTRFAFIGRSDSDKGFMEFCRAMSLLPRALIGGIDIIGDGPQLREGLEFLRLCGRSDLVAQAGRVPHEAVPDRLRAASVVVHPSSDEGLPAAVMEAMACGLAVIASAVGGIPEVVKHGETGLLTAPGDFADLVAACRSLAENAELRRRLGACARALVAARYDVSMTLADTKRLIAGTIGRGDSVDRSPEGSRMQLGPPSELTQLSPAPVDCGRQASPHGDEAPGLPSARDRGFARARRIVENLGDGFSYGTAVFRDPITSTSAIAAVKARMQERANVFLDTLERAVFAHPGSPYRPLFDAAGFDLQAVCALVSQNGIEAALHHLSESGVYVSIEEFKGLREARRGSRTFRFSERDFHNPLVQSGFRVASGGTRSAGIRTPVPVTGLRFHAEHFAVAFAAHGLEGLPVCVWRPQFERTSLLNVMALAAMGHTPRRWVSQLPGWRLASPDETHAYFVGINLAARFRGLKFPRRTYVPLGDEARGLAWIAEQDGRGGCVVLTIPSAALRLALAAKKAGHLWTNTTFITAAEALTPAKAAAIAAIGSRVRTIFAFSEFGLAGYSCASPATPDEMHFCSDLVAVTARRRPADQLGSEVNALQFTSLRPDARRTLLNTETGDYGKLSTRRCGCLLESLGWTERVEEVRSFEKLNLESWAFFGTKLIDLVEERLPARFGGDPTDYQLFEHEDDAGHTRLTLLVHPRLGAVSEDAIIACIEEFLGVAPSWVSARVYRRLGSLQVWRRAPMMTPAGKVMPLHRQAASSMVGAGSPTR